MNVSRFFAVVVGCLGLIAPGAPGVRAATVLVHYGFDSNFNDDSGNNNHLSGSSGTPDITVAAGETAFGAGALNLDQSGTQEHLAFDTFISFAGSDAWSMSWWGKRSSNALIGQGMVVGTINNSNNFVWTPDNSDVVQGLRLRNSNGVGVDYGGIADDNEYHHWAVSYNGSNSVTAWRDGVNLGTKTWGGGIVMTHVGAGTASQTNSFYGQIDELYLFTGTLSAADVISLRDNNTLAAIPAPAALPAGLVMMAGMLMRRRGGRR
jgi:hypothetical protein